MSAGVFLDRLARLMGSNPPSADDEPMISRLRRIGVAPGAPFAFDRLPSPSRLQSSAALPAAGPAWQRPRRLSRRRRPRTAGGSSAASGATEPTTRRARSSQ